MTISKSIIADRIKAHKEWQKINIKKIDNNPHLEGYNAAINTEILFLEELIAEPVVVEETVAVVEPVSEPVPVVKPKTKNTKKTVK